MNILFSEPMVRAILECRKTQTRRVAKVDVELYSKAELLSLCPYKVGEVLDVRETFYAYGHWKYYRGPKGRWQWSFVDRTKDLGFDYRYCTNKPTSVERRPATETMEGASATPNGWWKRPALFMPKEAVRLRIEIVQCGLQYLKDIWDYEAEKEGVAYYEEETLGRKYRNYLRKGVVNEYSIASPRESFFTLWDSINGEGASNKNPLVWAYKFEAIK